ncbi:unnamed protein product [Parascedosporium putredinis]|uniref:GDP/GTP exchange factor Sec2 N-terminal domain-containing protein n=1 Tax=Parascedosporium putredinis TaxID=1442378 RepID=A0A9P1H9W3_9PEZI|nr:unnamed protein product [Parascedosporium putredinis]CAI8001406.1 unnamed protein product [Parascedosporium putredinis]
MRVSPWTSFTSEASTSEKTSAPKPASRSSFGHFRSLSSITTTKSSSPTRPSPLGHGRSPSTSQLPDFTFPLRSSPTSVSPASPIPSPDEDSDLSTLPDPRIRAMSPLANCDGSVVSDGENESHDEVTTLSNKLIRAINHQTILDNNLGEARRDLEVARDRIRQLEELTESQREMLAGDVVEERKAKEEVEEEKRKIERELENLTTALFEEANKMVVAAKEDAQKQQETMEKKNEQLRAQIADTESLLRSQQEQLAELKLVMEQMTADHDDQTNLTAPSSPGFSRFDSKDQEGRLRDGLFASSPFVEPVSPAYPTSFVHLIQPVLRTDLAAFEDFKLLSHASKHNRSASRASASSLSGINVMNLGLGHIASGGSIPSPTRSGTHSSSPSASSLTGGGPLAHSPSSTAISPKGSQAPTPTATPVSVGSLKDAKFYKRALVEDIEPTLRLDTAPGLSWLARRSVITAMTEGTLVVEPAPASPLVPSAPSPQHVACSLCGESRKDTEHLRTHRFRTSESDSAQRYPLCAYCLGRVRSTCDFLGFLRILKDGLWRTDDADAEKAAWEEAVRLREQMFWARVGGGVVPANQLIAPSSSLPVSASASATNVVVVDGDKTPPQDPTNDGAEDHAESQQPKRAETAVAGRDGEDDEVTGEVVTPSPSPRNSTQPAKGLAISVTSPGTTNVSEVLAAIKS